MVMTPREKRRCTLSNLPGQIGSVAMKDVSTLSPIPAVIDALWERRAELSPADAEARAAVAGAVGLLDQGRARIAWPSGDTVTVDERARRAILLSFKVLGMSRSQ